MYIYKVGVVGAGAMGAEIAQVVTFSGLPVILKDVDDARVQHGMDTIRKIYQRRVDKGKLSAEDMQAKLALVSGTTTYEPFREVDLVIEAVSEQADLKHQVLRDLDRVCPASSIVASNTSSISISELGATTQRPHKVIGMHFFYPAHVMKLVEVIPGLDTAEETVSDVVAFAESLRKLPIRVNECPGFLVNRLLMPYLNEAALCLQEGVATAPAMDQAMTAFGLPMGPCTLVDTLGFDICHDVVVILNQAYGHRMQPAAIWQAMYDKGRWGIKRGAGFYLYGERAGQPDTDLEGILRTTRSSSKSPRPFSIHRLLLPMVNEAVLCLQEHISSAADIDLAMLAGLGFPQDKQGILHYADQIGLDVVLQELTTLAQHYGERFWPAPLLRRKVGAGHLGVKAKRGFFDYP